MCINPSILPDGTTFACRKCWQCRENKVQDWVGRCIAQSKTSSHTYAVTLTYGGGDHERATVLTYSDVQKYFKRLRKAGFKFRYLVAGEYGSRKGRAHWHLVLFFDGAVPKHQLRTNFQDPFWGHGHSFWDDPSPSAVRYVCKYVLKAENDEEAQAHFMMSKVPPIGSEYFAQMALDYVAAKLAPQDLRYTFTDNRDKDGKRIQHYMHGATARDFLSEYVYQWQVAYGDEEMPASELVQDHIDKYTRYAPDPVMQVRPYGIAPRRMPRTGAKLEFSDAHNTYTCMVDGVRYLWKMVTTSKDREWAWHDPRNRLVGYEALDPKPEGPTPSGRPQETKGGPNRSPTTRGEPRSATLKERKRVGKLLPMVGDRWDRPGREPTECPSPQPRTTTTPRPD